MKSPQKQCKAYISMLVIVSMLLNLIMPVYANATDVFSALPMVAGGFNHSIVLRNDGTVWAWGENAEGQLGTGNTTNYRTPTQIKELSEIVTVAAGIDHSMALKSDGTVWAWGKNNVGQLGQLGQLDDSSFTKRTTPVKVDVLDNVTAIAAGLGHSLALKSDGTVWAWGANDLGELGTGDFVSSITPRQVKDLSGIKSIAVGYSHSLAIKDDGTVWAWGWNCCGAIGDGTFSSVNPENNRNTPVKVPGIEGATAIAAGFRHSLALKDDGTVWGWGRNDTGQLGDNTFEPRRLSPVKVQDLDNVKSIAAGYNHSSALKNDGTVWSWGINGAGQLGDSTNTSKSTPVRVGELENVSVLNSGANHSLAIKSDGAVWSWGGGNCCGELGNDRDWDFRTPGHNVQVLGVDGEDWFNAGEVPCFDCGQCGCEECFRSNNGDCMNCNDCCPPTVECGKYYKCGYCNVCKPVLPPFIPKYGYILGNKTVGIGDALEVLKYLANMKSEISKSNARAWNAAIITPASKKAGKPGIGDALEILKALAGMKSLVS